jgi:hypothetical protein
MVLFKRANLLGSYLHDIYGEQLPIGTCHSMELVLTGLLRPC